MLRGLLGRLAKWPVRVCVAVALLVDAPQQLELSSTTTTVLAYLGSGAAPAQVREPQKTGGLASRSAVVVVKGVAWLAVVSLPFAEPGE
jgi:hypothetical protein